MECGQAMPVNDTESYGPLCADPMGRGHELSSDDQQEHNIDDKSRGPAKKKLKRGKSALRSRDHRDEDYHELAELPSAESYEKSYMHRDFVTHILASRDFILTVSAEGSVKFWRRSEGDSSLSGTKDATKIGSTTVPCPVVEFVKQYRAHFGQVADVSLSPSSELAITVGVDDGLLSLFDIASFDLINRVKLGFVPSCCCFLDSAVGSTAVTSVAVVEQPQFDNDGIKMLKQRIFVVDARSAGQTGVGDMTHVLHTIEKLHSRPVSLLRLNAHFDAVVSADDSGFLEVWGTSRFDFSTDTPPTVKWRYKTETDFYEFVKLKTFVVSLTFTSDGRLMATMGGDRRVRLFLFATGKIIATIDHSLERYRPLVSPKGNQVLPNEEKEEDLHIAKTLTAMELGRRLAVERDVDSIPPCTLASRLSLHFDESNKYLLYPTFLGVHILNCSPKLLAANKKPRCVRILGWQENLRFMSFALLQGAPQKRGISAALSIEQVASSNIALTNNSSHKSGSSSRPVLAVSAFRRNRFYLITRREAAADADRDIFNEKPMREEILTGATSGGMGPSLAKQQRLAESATIHTTFGDIVVELYMKECPRSVENFCQLSRQGYYDGHIFHRVIRGFMVQTGDPLGTGVGGQSIWGKDFEDEINPALKHDRPFTLSMANAGTPCSNGSQFFITVVPAPWLDGKHTIFGRVTKGMDVVLRISNVKTDKRTDKPEEEVKVAGVTIR